jgi:hypothetical protein
VSFFRCLEYAYTKVVILSTESIASSSPSVGAVQTCAGCGALLAADQRYCLECGERRTPMSSVLLGSPPVSGASQSGAPPAPPPAPAATDASQRANTVSVIAGVGVLLLAMGVGVLIGRAGNSKPVAAPAQTINLAQPGASTPGPGTTPTTPATTVPEASLKSGSPLPKGGALGTGSSKAGGSGKKAGAGTAKSSSPNSGKSYAEKSKNLPNVVETH